MKRQLKTSNKVFIVIAILTLLATLLAVAKRNIPIAYGTGGSLPYFTIDDKINKAELILIGKVTTTLPSMWMGPNGSDPKDASEKEIIRARGLFTDSLLSVKQIFKGEIADSQVRVRVFTGKTKTVVWASSSEPSYVKGRVYLLFLREDAGPTAYINPGYYKSVGAFQGVYEIVGDRAISKDDEWNLEELIAYIQSKLAESTVTPTLEENSQPVETTLPEEETSTLEP